MKSSTKPWVHYAAKINALSLRERAILFGSTMLVVGALADTLVLSPARTEQQQIKTKLTKLSAELTVLRAQVASSGGQAGGGAEKDTPRATVMTAIQQAQEAQAEMDSQLRATLASPEQVARLPDLMAKVMRQQPSLTLSKLATIAPDQDRALLDKLTKIYRPTSSGTTPPESPELAVQMHGVDFGVIGPYLELTRYLGDLERAMPGLRWGELHLHAEPGSTNAPLMEVRVYLMGASS
ncbi:hypothetical protein [Aquabacterium sp.]|uniref:hypothetical protein n=1 Tax=Aquabacterium sp. TaxID=1872578 RepID=UPI0019C2B527|nr:hypothetical protein [Aquabacterium sp.]MBC7701680.1 hypothetical protein [Aquabacterium sp.]